MNPHQKNKVDVGNMSAEEQRLFRMYGKLPNKKDLLQNKLMERKYFDSGDYALSKAGKASDAGVTQIGREHPNPNTIPHLSSPLLQHERNGSIGGASIGGPPQFSPTSGTGGGAGSFSAGSPIKEGSFLQRETSVDDVKAEETAVVDEGVGMPIRGAR